MSDYKILSAFSLGMIFTIIGVILGYSLYKPKYPEGSSEYKKEKNTALIIGAVIGLIIGGVIGYLFPGFGISIMELFGSFSQI